MTSGSVSGEAFTFWTRQRGDWNGAAASGCQTLPGGLHQRRVECSTYGQHRARGTVCEAAQAASMAGTSPEITS